jgi:hypothetical protein
MSVNLEWYVEPHVCIVRCPDRWQWSELYESLAAASDIADSVAPIRVDTILDIKHSQMVPEGPIITHLRNSILRSRPNHGITVIVGADRVVKSFVSMFDKVYPAMANRYRLADDTDEAMAIIHLHRELQANADLRPDETIPHRAMLSIPASRQTRR